MLFQVVGIGVAVVAVGGVSYWLVQMRASNRNKTFIAKKAKESPATKDAPAVVQTAQESDAPAVEKEPAQQAVLNTRPPVAELSSLPESAKNKLVNAVWYRCENPYCNHTNFLEVHHIISEVEGGTNSLDNLIVFCSDCHHLADNHEIPLDIMKSWIVQRKDRFKDALDWPYK